jgi:dihydroxy-acid dehydratase
MGGPVGLLQTGDKVTIDSDTQEINMHVDEEELSRRKAAWTAPEPRYKTGILAKYARLVSSSAKGAVTDADLD